MGNAKSTCRVVNEARYEITVELFSPKDVGGEFAKQKLTVLPGNHCELPTPKKGIQLRISGNGRVQDLQRAVPGESIVVRKVQRGFAAHPEPAAEVTEDVGKHSEPQEQRHSAPQESKTEQVMSDKQVLGRLLPKPSLRPAATSFMLLTH